MWLRIWLITIAAVMILGGAGRCRGCDQSAPLNPVDRFVLGLILTDNRAANENRTHGM
jgi:hypothetical protein